MLLLAPMLGLLPHATLAAVVIVYSVGLIQPAEFRAIRRVRTMEFRWALIACAGCAGVRHAEGHRGGDHRVAGRPGEPGRPSARLTSSAASAAPTCCGRCRPSTPTTRRFEGLLIVRPEGRLFFVNAQYVADQIERWSRSTSRACSRWT